MTRDFPTSCGNRSQCSGIFIFWSVCKALCSCATFLNGAPSDSFAPKEWLSFNSRPDQQVIPLMLPWFKFFISRESLLPAPVQLELFCQSDGTGEGVWMLFCSSYIRQAEWRMDVSLSRHHGYGINDVSIIISSGESASHNRTPVDAAARDEDNWEGNGVANNASRCDDSSTTGRDWRDDSTIIPGDPRDDPFLPSPIHRPMCIPVIADSGSGGQMCNLTQFSPFSVSRKYAVTSGLQSELIMANASSVQFLISIICVASWMMLR